MACDRNLNNGTFLTVSLSPSAACSSSAGLLDGDPQKQDLCLVKTRARNQGWHGMPLEISKSDWQGISQPQRGPSRVRLCSFCKRNDITDAGNAPRGCKTLFPESEAADCNYYIAFLLYITNFEQQNSLISAYCGVLASFVFGPPVLHRASLDVWAATHGRVRVRTRTVPHLCLWVFTRSGFVAIPYCK